MAWLTGWGFRKELTIQHANVDGNLTDFPVYVFIDADADFHESLANGHDIRFTESDGDTLLKYERMYWTGGNGAAATAHFWVKVPTILAAGGTTIYIYYGKVGAADGEDAANVWDANFKGIWHFEEAAGHPQDSSGNANHADDEVISNYQQAGKIHYSIDLDGTNDYVRVPDSADWTVTPFTVEGWFNLDVWTGGNDMLFYTHEHASDDGMRIYEGATKIEATTEVSNVQAATTYNDNSTIETWVHVALTRDAGGLITIYRDGVAQTDTEVLGGEIDNADPLYFGRSRGAGDYIDGKLEEWRFSNTDRSVNWLKFQHANMHEGDQELTWAAEETSGYTLAVAAGSYAITGQTINLLHDKLISIGAGAYVLTGQVADLLYGEDWQSYADKYVNEPVVVCEMALDSGTLKFAVDYIRPTNAAPYIGNILRLPTVSNSIGDLIRRTIYSNITIEFSDTDRTFREITEGIKNRIVTLKLYFINQSMATVYLTFFTGQIYDWDFLEGMRFRLVCEQIKKNMENPYPDKYVDLTDYADAHSSAINKLIPIPYGTISALGLSGDGAFPTLFVDTTVDAEKHLIGLQAYTELIINGEFGSDTSIWFPSNAAVLASVAGGRTGNCLSITENGAALPQAYQHFTVKPGSAYRVHGYIKAGTEDEYKINIWDATNSSWLYEGAWLQETAGDWSTEFEATFTAPTGCVSTRVILYSRSQLGEGKVIYFDAITATEVISVSRVYKNGVLQTEGGGNDYTVGYGIIGTESGFVLNGGFPVDTSSWTAARSAALASVAGGETGNCLRITEGGADFPTAYQDITVVPGVRYNLIGSIKKGTEDVWIVRIKNAATDSLIYWAWGIETAGDWSAGFSLYFNAPSGCTSVRIELSSWSENGEGKAIYFDTITCSVVTSIVHVTIDWEAGNNPTASDIISCDIIFGTRGTVEAVRHSLENFRDYVSGDFHAASYNAARAIEQNREFTLDGAFVMSKKLKSHLDDIKDEFELDIWTDPKDGLIHFMYLTSDMSVTNHYKDYLDILTGYEPKIQVTKIMNYLDYYYNYNYARQYFHNHAFREDADSQSEHEATFKDEKKYYFIRSSTGANDLAARRILRRKDPIVLDTFNFPLKTFNDNLGDAIEITHYGGKGSSGYEQKIFQIRKTDYNLDKFINRMTLEDISSFIGKAFIMGPAALPDYITATAAQREKYGFLCDPVTEEYSNGDPAKRMYD